MMGIDGPLLVLYGSSVLPSSIKKRGPSSTPSEALTKLLDPRMHPKHMLKLKGEKIFTILRANILFIYVFKRSFVFFSKEN